MKYTLKGELFKNIQTIRDECESKQIAYDYAIHGCNAQGVMGSGFAKALKAKFPKAYQDYRHQYEDCGLSLGDTVFSDQGKGIIVINAVTQEFYGRDGKIYCDYTAIRHCFEDIIRYLDKVTSEWKFKIRLHYPKIGAGLGGGDWNTIENIIDKVVDGKYDQYLHLG